MGWLLRHRSCMRRRAWFETFWEDHFSGIYKVWIVWAIHSASELLLGVVCGSKSVLDVGRRVVGSCL